MKYFYTVLTCIIFSTTGFSQSYYETSWTSNNVKYNALVIFYDDDSAIVRVKYFANGAEKLAGFNVTYEDFTKADGSKDRYLNGSDAWMVRGPSNSTYSADNFYLQTQTDGSIKAYTVDDNGFNGGDITQYMKPMLYWIPLIPESVTKSYLDDYFDRDEALYQYLDYYINGEFAFATKTTAITTLAHGPTTDGLYNDGIWSVVMSDLGSKAYSEQTIKESGAFPSDWVRNQWNNGFFITAMAYDTVKSKFVVVMSKRYGMGPQSWKKDTSFPKDWVTEKWNDNYHISSMTCGGGEWYVVMEQNTGYTGQRWKTSYEIPQDWIKDNWNEGYAITSATYGNGLWALTMSASANLGTQTWRTEQEYPIDWIREKSGQGYSISTIAHGNNMWFVVMSTGSSISANRSTSSYVELPVEWIMNNANAEGF